MSNGPSAMGQQGRQPLATGVRMAIGGMRRAREFFFEFAALGFKFLVFKGQLVVLLLELMALPLKLMALPLKLMAVAFELTIASLEPVILLLERRHLPSRSHQLIDLRCGAGFKRRQQGGGTFIVQGMPLHARLTIVGQSTCPGRTGRMLTARTRAGKPGPAFTQATLGKCVPP